MRIISLIALTFATASCSVTRMSDVFPETACGDHGQVVIGDHNTNYAPIVSGGKSSAVGYGEVVGVQVYKGKKAKSAGYGGASGCYTAGHAFGLGGSTFIDPYTTSAHYGLGGNVGLSGFATLPYSSGLVTNSYVRPALVLNSASGYGMNCGSYGYCGSTTGYCHQTGACAKKVTCRKVVKETERNYEIQK